MTNVLEEVPTHDNLRFKESGVLCEELFEASVSQKYYRGVLARKSPTFIARICCPGTIQNTVSEPTHGSKMEGAVKCQNQWLVTG